VISWARSGPPTPTIPPILLASPLADEPTADIAVVLSEDSSRGDFYAVGFKTNHRVVFVPKADAGEWRREHPEGYLLARQEDRAWFPHYVTKINGWMLFRASSE